MIVTVLLTCLFLALVHYYFIQFSRKGRLINRLPGPISFPIIGNLLQISWRSPEDMWLFLREITNSSYPISKLWFFHKPHVIICHPDHMQKLLRSTEYKRRSWFYKHFHSWFGDSFFINEGIKWQQKRKIITPLFPELNQFVDVLTKEANAATKHLNHAETSTIRDLQSFTSHYALNTICEILTGISLRNTGPFEQKYYQAVHDMTSVIANRFYKPWLLNDTIFKLTSLGSMQDKCLKILHSLPKKVSRNVFDILVEKSSCESTASVVREELNSLIFAAHETVGVSACFSLLLLAEHKDVQDRVREEICQVIQETDGKFTMNALQNLTYLTRCLKESLRMYPSVPIISRTCAEDIQLQPYLVPKDTILLLSIYDLHHDRNYWPSPEIFDPDRFLPENIQKHHPYFYIPFSAGPRNCLGQRFAMLELKALVATMVYNFYLEPIDYLKDVKFKLDVTLRATHPIRMKVVPIKRT